MRMYLKVIRELGLRQVGLFGLYQMGKRIGVWRWMTSPPKPQNPAVDFETTAILPIGDIGLAAQQKILEQAKEILAGRVRLFGGDPVPLDLDPGIKKRHWSYHEKSMVDGKDIKWIWEPARFGWAITLAQAWYLTGDPVYPNAFWIYAKQFSEYNPVFQGPNWSSGQEVALRLLATVYSLGLFQKTRHPGQSPEFSSDQLDWFSGFVYQHAVRIPPTIVYALAQNNNHLLSEAAALYTAGWFLQSHPQSKSWRRLGWRWFHYGIQTQIEPDGTYIQQSVNYHRLMLQVAMWMQLMAEKHNQNFPSKSSALLAAATHWYGSLVDEVSGGAPNLGANDGAYIFPMSVSGFADHRPVLEAARRVFLGKQHSVHQQWVDLSTWLGLETGKRPDFLKEKASALFVCKHPTVNNAWGYLRAEKFRNRPGHADQMHVDLWWEGVNITLDPGTYLYNMPSPWDNPFTYSAFHNTLTINGKDQMSRVSRFLYVNKSEGWGLEQGPGRMAAEHNAYRGLSINHRRTLEPAPDGWHVIDEVNRISTNREKQGQYTIRMHWLFPDWQWEIEDTCLRLFSPLGVIQFSFRVASMAPFEIHLYRAGKCVYGEGNGVCETLGYVSPTYGYRTPALAFVLKLSKPLPIKIVSRFLLPVDA